jgi:hypothetical protein
MAESFHHRDAEQLPKRLYEAVFKGIRQDAGQHLPALTKQRVRTLFDGICLDDSVYSEPFARDAREGQKKICDGNVTGNRR